MASLPPLLTAILWVVIGAGLGAAHLVWLWRAVRAVDGQEPVVAGRRLSGGLPLRLVVMLPFLLVAVNMGFYACIGVVIGLWLGRALAYLLVSRMGSGQEASGTAGQD